MCGIWKYISNYIDKSNIKYYFKLFNNLNIRGPDNSHFSYNNNEITGFHRLWINDLNYSGMQPFIFYFNNIKYELLCNGEIYNYRTMYEKIRNKYDLKWNSDCEIIIPYFYYYCNNNIQQLQNDINGEYAMIITIYNKNNDVYILNDELGVRPLFYNETDKELIVSSLLKGLPKENNFKNTRLKQGEIRHYNKYLFIKNYENIFKDQNIYNIENEELYELIRLTLYNCIEKRLVSDRPLCCLLSGGLDSSLIAAIVWNILKKQGKKLNTFTIGLKEGTDLKYAREVWEYIGSKHTEIIFTEEEGLKNIKNVIYSCETFDITTIRASVGQYLISKYIKENTDFKVILNGDGADEIQMGYLYYYLNPNDDEAQKDSEKLINNICYFDGLRVDRNISNFGLEARVPYLDKEFVNLYMKINPKLKKPTIDRMEKYLIRKAFQCSELLPEKILWRKKEAFSDGVSKENNSWYSIVSNYINLKFLNEKEDNKIINKEAFYYKKKYIKYFGKQSETCIPYIWMPNWSDVDDPSARKLKGVYI